VELVTVDSTNIYAMDHLQANLAAHGAVFFAHSQTAGKGQHGKNWVTEPGANIAMSVILDCSFLSLSHQFALSVMVSLAGYDLFSAYAGEETFIKWPNDLYWRDRKAGGILIETLVRGNIWQAAVVGMGINLNQTQFPKTLHNPVSLRQITGKDFNTITLAHELCSHLQNRYQQLQNGGEAAMLVEYSTHLYKKDQEVKLKKGPVVFTGVIAGVSANGELLVKSGLEESFRFGEIEWVLPAGK
jgi:BirA family biotin operon repressor/biotin-[acetyl-CoA-carboxylase] ligase